MSLYSAGRRSSRFCSEKKVHAIPLTRQIATRQLSIAITRMFRFSRLGHLLPGTFCQAPFARHLLPGNYHWAPLAGLTIIPCCKYFFFWADCSSSRGQWQGMNGRAFYLLSTQNAWRTIYRLGPMSFEEPLEFFLSRFDKNLLIHCKILMDQQKSIWQPATTDLFAREIIYNIL